jgi:hypothetical protein
MAQLRQFSRPGVGAAAGLHPDETGMELRDEGSQLRPRESAAQDRVARGIDAMKLKDVLGQIDSHA